MHSDVDPAKLPPTRRGLQLLLPDHHRRLEALARELLACACGDEPRDLVQRWRQLEAELLDHLAAEEEVILPSYAGTDPADAQKIRDDHALIRALVTPIGIDVELHEMRVERLRRLVDTLAAHARHEDAVMYPWADQHLSAVAQRLLYVRVSAWFGVVVP